MCLCSWKKRDLDVFICDVKIEFRRLVSVFGSVRESFRVCVEVSVE